ncbi:hypothetical protein ACFL59_15920, partial [Planctomycetota bacterium]
PATGANKQAAQGFVETLRADGGTHTGRALEDAFKHEKCDTIFLLTDGAPMKYGDDKLDARYREEILQETRKRNRYRRVRIHCLGFTGAGVWPKERGPRPESLAKLKTADFVTFLTQLASENWGEFTSIP